MTHKATKLFAVLAILAASIQGFAQDPQEQEREQQKKFDEYIEKQVDSFTTLLDLEDWQMFYVDSILRADKGQLGEEIKDLSKSRVYNSDLYVMVQDRCDERIYNAFRKVFNDEQWAKYLKTGAAREKKARDKRAAKRESGSK